MDAEALVEAVTLEEAQKEVDDDGAEVVDQDLEEEASTTANESLALDNENEVITTVDQQQQWKTKDSYWCSVKVSLTQASFVIENVVPKQSLVVYMRNMKAKFKDKNRQQHIRVVTEDCGIDNVTLSDNRFEPPHRKPLLQLIKNE